MHYCPLFAGLLVFAMLFVFVGEGECAIVLRRRGGGRRLTFVDNLLLEFWGDIKFYEGWKRVRAPVTLRETERFCQDRREFYSRPRWLYAYVSY